MLQTMQLGVENKSRTYNAMPSSSDMQKAVEMLAAGAAAPFATAACIRQSPQLHACGLWEDAECGLCWLQSVVVWRQ